MIDLKRVTWQSENCLSCKWFVPSDPLNADILISGKCVHPSMIGYELVVSGRDWCNLFETISQRQIDQMQGVVTEKESSEKQ
ncbi:hypothetical protein EPN87_02995 [archaeon]|nr:MAG: hypothetical protein EPN87_02995 [archaeon]